MNSELKQDLTEFLRLSLVDDEFINQYIDDITSLFEEQGEWADEYVYWQEKGILPKILNTNIMMSISTGMKMHLLWMGKVTQA